MVVSIQARGTGSNFKSDWNELDDFPEEVSSYMYFVEMGGASSPEAAEEEKSDSADAD